MKIASSNNFKKSLYSSNVSRKNHWVYKYYYKGVVIMKNNEVLINAVLEKSVSQNWYYAVQEWRIVDAKEDIHCKSACVCGKENIRYLYTLQNTRNGNTLSPIGSSCIRKFERQELNEQILVQEGLFKLIHAITNNQRIELTSEYFSRKLLEYMAKNDVFKPNKYNNYDGNVDYRFMLKMFNNQTSPTTYQQTKINIIIAYEIKPYIKRISKEKIIY